MLAFPRLQYLRPPYFLNSLFILYPFILLTMTSTFIILLLTALLARQIPTPIMKVVSLNTDLEHLSLWDSNKHVTFNASEAALHSDYLKPHSFSSHLFFEQSILSSIAPVPFLGLSVVVHYAGHPSCLSLPLTTCTYNIYIHCSKTFLDSNTWVYFCCIVLEHADKTVRIVCTGKSHR